MANLPAMPAKMSCADLAQTTEVAGQSIQITEQQTASASPSSPEYCAVTGHINTNIGFEILLPISTWRQRYLQVGCGGLCGSIGINPPADDRVQAAGGRRLRPRRRGRRAQRAMAPAGPPMRCSG